MLIRPDLRTPWIKSLALPLALVTLLVGLGSCRDGSRAVDRIASDSAAAQDFDSNLTFNNIVLEQADEDGQILWEVNAEQAIYSQDQQVAQVRSPEGELFQDGEPVFRIRAQSGEVQQDGEKILLNGAIVATDIQSGAVLRGDELEWLPQEDLLIIRNSLTGTHPQVRVSAREARVHSREQRIELRGQVVATTRDPNLRLKAEHLTWQTEEQMILSDRPIRVERLRENQITDQATGDQAEVDLEAKIVTLGQNGELDMSQPPLSVTSDSLVWNLDAQTLMANQFVTVLHRQQRITLTANQGRMDLQRQVFYLTSNVRAVGQRNRSQLNSDSLTWNIPSQQVEAEGDVVYSQVNPPLNLRGPRAVGRLENQTIVVSGGRVVTEIIPGNLN